MKILLLDMDILVYTVSFACAKETEEWKVAWTARKMFENYCKISGATHYIAYLTHSQSNFRIKAATTWPYKGERKSIEKPVWFDLVRGIYESLAQEVHGIEADDALTIAAEHFRTKGIPVVCATKDKDLKQYPWDEFLDMNTDTMYSISEPEAHRNLWKQMLIGDVAVDNIPGISHAAKYETTVEKDKGSRGAKDLLLGAKGAEDLLDLWSPEDYCVNTYSLYLDAYAWNIGNTQEVRDICYEKGWLFGEYRFYETWTLIHMLLEAPQGVEVNLDYKPVPEVQVSNPTNEFTNVDEELL